MYLDFLGNHLLSYVRSTSIRQAVGKLKRTELGGFVAFINLPVCPSKIPKKMSYVI